MKFGVLAAGLLMAAAPAFGQQIAAYYAWIGQADMYNSSGARLGDFGAVLQQDRANFHRFGIRQGGDESDPLFGNRQNRSAIPSMYARGPRDRLIERIVMGGDELGIVVFVCDRGSGPYLVVNFADGDGYGGC